jgi:phage terminase Nu1 subunit (DNA packaging protein)
MTRNKVTSAQMAEILEINTNELFRLTNAGVLQRSTEARKGHERVVYDWRANVKAYIRHLTKPARQAQDDYVYERHETQRIIRQQKELEYGLATGDLIKREKVTLLVVNLLSATKNHLLAVPSRLTRVILGITDYRTAYNLLYDAVELALRELVEFDAEKIFATAHAKNGQPEKIKAAAAARRRR